jgi:putative addiction module component (TIGR02574 family)
MSLMTVEGIIKEALQKPESERAKIAETLISSLHELPPLDIEEAWQKEIQRRVKEIHSGEVECIPWEEIRDRLHGNANAKD